eukprot:TRINITY_DN28265_c0_g1_i1.p1 TRINITY_DN28265_c0_g1~~TRINITY_DN28265_c0_g1_i1.p1  ORF type:complete len:511 (+),score=84.19 TRINITY_DN28265_c0_g1_i1:65-1597(+)
MTTSGVTLFDVPDLVEPVSQCVSAMQDELILKKMDLLSEMRRDPAPQFSVEEVKSAERFLDEARAAMQSAVENFKPEALKSIDDDAIKVLQDKCRESARRLVLLFGDTSRKFDGNRMQGQLISIQESSQVAEVRQRLSSLKSFFDTFATAEWLGHLFAANNFRKELRTVLALLDALLNPSPAMTLKNLSDIQGTRKSIDSLLFDAVKDLWTMQQSERHIGWNNAVRRTMPTISEAFEYEFSESEPYGLHRSDTSKWKDAWRRWRQLKDMREQLKLKQGVTSRTCKGQPPVASPLTSIFNVSDPPKSLKDALLCLTKMCDALKSVIEKDEQQVLAIKSNIEAKLASLVEFAEVLNSIVDILKRYVLIRLGDIDKDDLNVLKQWVTHEEATEVHKMLEAFRDEATYERAVRAATAKMMPKQSPGSSWQYLLGSESASSLKEYLFESSVGYSQQAFVEADEDSNPSVEDAPDVTNKEATDQKSKKKLSRHQRERRAKFRAWIPRTPCSGSYQH